MTEIHGRPAEILLIEDNPEDVRLMVEAFKTAKLGNHLNTVEDGVQALDFLRRKGRFADVPRPDLVLLDLNLPLKNGRDVLAEIKSDGALKTIPVVILTGSSNCEDVARAYDLQANAFITKPVDLDRFVEVVRSIESFWISVVVRPPSR